MSLRRLLLAIAVAMATVPAFAGTARADSHGDEAAFVADTNAVRASVGAGGLVVDSRLTSMARSWAQQMANAGQISHTPNLAAAAPSDWQVLGENVGVGPTEPSVQQAF